MINSTSGTGAPRHLRSFDFNHPAVINLVDESAEKALRDGLLQRTFAVITLNGHGIDHREQLFEQFTAQVIEQGVVSNWSNLGDLLTQRLWNAEQRDTALLWTGVDDMLHGGLADLLTCVGVLTAVSRDLYPKNKVHLNFLLGRGPNFPPPAA